MSKMVSIGSSSVCSSSLESFKRHFYNWFWCLLCVYLGPSTMYTISPIFFLFFFIYTIGAAHSLNSTFNNMPIFTNQSSSLFISSIAVNGMFHFFLKMGRVFSFSLNFALILVHLLRPAENTSGKLPFSSILIFSASAVMHSTFWQNILIGWFQRLNFWNQSDPNKFSVFFSTKTFNFLVIPFSDTGIIISPSNFILSPVTVRAVLLVIFIIGLFNFLQVCKFIIDTIYQPLRSGRIWHKVNF